MAEELDKLTGIGVKKMFHGNPKNKTGLDIGSHAIKVVEISDVAGRQTLSAFGLKNIAGLARQDIPNSIKELVAAARITGREFNVSVAGPSVIVRFITMPKMSEDEIRAAVRFEAEKFIPFNINECILDFQILNKQAKTARMDVLLVAVKKDKILEKVKIVEDAGFSVRVVDVDSFAVANAFLRNFSALEPEKSIAVINIGASLTGLTVLKNGQACLVRDVAVGGSAFDDAIAKGLNLSKKDAEELKILPKEKLQDMSNLTKPVIGALLDEIKLSIGYHENQSGSSVDDIYISGGGSGLSAIGDVFEEAFGSRPKPWDPLQFLDTAPLGLDKTSIDKTRNFVAVAVGLALR